MPKISYVLSRTIVHSSPKTLLERRRMTSMCIYMTTQQSGMQQTQQSHPPQPQSMHLVLPGAVPTGLIIELVAEPGRTKLTGLEVESVHISSGRNEGRQRLGSGPSRRMSEMLNGSLKSVQDTDLFIYIYGERDIYV